MFGSVALDIVIGLVFIYLLYSLFATVLSEIIATKLGLRSRNLKEAINRMLSDEEVKSFIGRLWDSLRLMKNPKTDIIKEFYNHPEIKYLGSSGLFKTPSSFKAVSFSKTLLNLLSNDQPITKELLDAKLIQVDTAKPRISIRETLGDQPKKILLDPDTSKYLRIMWSEANGDIAKFKFLLEGWFDRTMEQATEWYKRKIQIVLLVLGFMIAWFFNADTFDIINKLSIDKDARDKIVSMANSYIQSHPQGNVVPGDPTPAVTSSATPDSSTQTPQKSKNAESQFNQQRWDSLIEVKNKLQADINNANTLLGLGGWLPDSLQVVKVKGIAGKKWCKACSKNSACKCPEKSECYYSARYHYFFTKDTAIVSGKKITIAVTCGDKYSYLCFLFRNHFIGFLITAIAISLGAPFWFDLLNKLMKLRTSIKQPTDSTENKEEQITLDKRVG